MSAAEDSAPQSASSLVSGIVGDLQQLVEQQFQLTRQEIEDELRQRAAAATILFIGVAVLFLAAIVACQSLALLLHWGTSPPGTDPGGISLWACYAIVAAILLAVGGALTLVGVARFKSVVRFHNPAREIL